MDRPSDLTEIDGLEEHEPGEFGKDALEADGDFLLRLLD